MTSAGEKVQVGAVLLDLVGEVEEEERGAARSVPFQEIHTVTCHHFQYECAANLPPSVKMSVKKILRRCSQNEDKTRCRLLAGSLEPPLVLDLFPSGEPPLGDG